MTLTERIKMLLPKEEEEQRNVYDFPPSPPFHTALLDSKIIISISIIQLVPVPTTFTWPYGGTTVYIAGSFNDWKVHFATPPLPSTEFEISNLNALLLQF